MGKQGVRPGFNFAAPPHPHHFFMNRTFQFRCTAELFSKDKPGAKIIDLQGTEHHIPNECEYAVEWGQPPTTRNNAKRNPANRQRTHVTPTGQDIQEV